MSKKAHSIGVFDSGVGGLTVMKELIKALPHEHLVYFGDTARVPYGEKSPDTILRFSIENSIFLMEQNIKLLVIACNTACAQAYDKLQQLLNIPVVGVIEPGAKKATQVTRRERIAVLGTKSTIQSGAYQRAIKRHLPDASITAVACPLFVPLVEEHFLSHDATRLIVKEYLAPLKVQQVDTVLLGCTHYPLLRPLIQEELGPDVQVVDSGTTCADQVSSLLLHNQLQSPHAQSGTQRYFVSDDPDKFRLLGSRFGMALDKVEVASTATRG